MPPFTRSETGRSRGAASTGHEPKPSRPPGCGSRRCRRRTSRWSGAFTSLNGWLASYWSDPVMPIEQSPELEEMFDHLDPEAEWDWLFSPETFRGREQLLQAAADYLETVGDWRVEIEELIDGSENRVLVIGRVVA